MDTGGGPEEKVTDQQAKSSPLYSALTGTPPGNFGVVFARFWKKENHPQYFPIARKALDEVIGRIGPGGGTGLGDLEKCLCGLSTEYGARMVNLEVLVSFFDKAKMTQPQVFFTTEGLQLVRYGRELLRQKKGASFKSDATTPVSQIAANECVRSDPLCKSLTQWVAPLLPHVEPLPAPKSSASEKLSAGGHSEKATFQQFRNNKDTICAALAFWRDIFSPNFKKQKEKFELLRWVACVHIEGLCSSNTLSALRCLTAFAPVVDLFPPELVEIFRGCLVLVCASHSTSVLDGLFPGSSPNKGDVADDPVRDLTIFQRGAPKKAHDKYEAAIGKMTKVGMGARQEYYSNQHSSSSPDSQFSPSKRRYIRNQDKMIPWHRTLVQELFFCMLQHVAPSELFGGVSTSLSALFSKSDGAQIWCTFICWWSECKANAASSTTSARGGQKRKRGAVTPSALSFEPPLKFATAIEDSFIGFWESLKNKSITVGEFFACAKFDLLHSAFEALGFDGSKASSTALRTEIQDANTKFQNLRKICETFISEDPCRASVASILSGWDKWKVLDLQYFLPSHAPKGSKSSPADPSLPDPIPPTLVASLPWVLFLLNSKLLHYLFTQELKDESPVLFKLELARRHWEEMFNQISKKTITFARLESLVEVLLLPGEIKLLYRSTRSRNFRKGSNPASLSWELRPANEKAINDITDSLNKFAHLTAVVNRLEEVGDCFALVGKYGWVQDIGSLEVYQQHVRSLSSALENYNWEKQNLSHYKRFATDCEAIHPSLLHLHPALFEKIYESPDLLGWLRTLANDQDFTRGIEMAMGRSEMECPPELWLSEGDNPGSGRVNEQILSMLQSVRSYLHSYIYRESLVFPTADSFIDDFLAHLLKFEKTILSQLDTCNLLIEPLKVLLGGDSEKAAPDRLLLMLQPASKAKWVCDNKMVKKELLGSSSEETQSCLRLEYTTQMKCRSLTVPEIEDFQSSVVLARTDDRTEEIQQKIVNFVQSFGWMKIYASHLMDLNSLGHFSYDAFTDVLSLTTDAEVIRERALGAQKTLSDWRSIVTSVREKYPSLNHFGMKLIWKLLEHLRERASGKFVPQPENSQSLVHQLVHLVNPVSVEDDGVIQRIDEMLVSEWVSLTKDDSNPSTEDSDGDEQMSLRDGVSGAMEVDETSYKERKLSLEDLLECCGKTVQAAFALLPLAHREVELPEGKHALKFKPGEVRLILARSYEHVFHETLSSFVQTHSFPERRTLLLCRETTDWDEVFLLLLRWRFSPRKDLFCLASADLLSNEVQIKAVEFIQSCLDVSAPLLVICGPVQSAYIASQFMNRRMASYALPRSFLQKLVRQTYDNRFLSYVSDYAGAGKSFQIRQRAEKGTYVPIPSTSIKQFLSLLHETLTKTTEPKEDSQSFFDETPNTFSFHFEVYDTAGVQLNSYLFEIIFFGGFCDFSHEVLFYYPPSTTSIAIELPTGPLAKHLIVPQLCPVEKIAPSPSTFAPSKTEMIQGMGLGLFYGKRYDGTAMRKHKAGVRHANAFDRLQYVCFALDVLKRNGGRFPFVFDCDVEEPEGLLDSLRLSASGNLRASQDGYLPGPECFELLLKVSDLSENSLSLWCLWNFINMVYWQLRDMHFPGSPLNMICTPSEEEEQKGGKKVNQKETNESKLLMKGELLSFIFRTAREFAMRQSNDVDPNEIKYAHVQGFSRPDFNGKWAKHSFTHCGRPVFFIQGHRTKYILHYRAKPRCWVIDCDIVLEGAYFAYGEGEDLGSTVWRSSCPWKVAKGAVGKTVKKKAGAYEGEGIEITGLPRDTENGLYLRQPPYDNINDHPHYIKLEGTRRHLFHTGYRWVICPVCTLEEGFLANAGGFNRWDIKPPDAHEPNVKITLVRYKDEHDDVVVQEDGNNYLLDEEAEDLAHRQEEEFQEFLRLEKLFERTKKWSESNHECLLFSNTNHVVSFMSMDPKKMEESMHPNLLAFLKQNRFEVGESLDQISKKHEQILGALTEVHREGEDAKNVGGGDYCLTGDNLLKMLAIFIRLRVGIPVILMGECGCGKTALLNYLCSWLGVELMVLDVHGGTTPREITEIFEAAERKRDLHKKPIYVFLDEVNACNHMGLICEVITKRTLHGKPIRDDIYILAALNPYRRRPKQEKTFGLVYKHKKGSVAPVMKDEMADLVYRVTPVPVALRDFVFDFGSLELDQERMYVRSMVHSMLSLPSLEGLEYTKAQAEEEKRGIDLDVITSLIVQSQVFIREKDGDPSSVSLRDVRRFISFANFFLKMEEFSQEWFVSSVVISLALIYYFRLSSEQHRTSYWEGIFDSSDTMRLIQGNCSFRIPENYRRLSDYVSECLKNTEFKFCKELELGEGIALNNALTENLFVAIMCILNKVPVFLVGKPGTSKTLTLQIIASNLQGKQSPNKFWRDYPSIYVISYQCSPMSDSASIQNQFNMAVRYQEHANNTITVLLLDEVGLAEHSPDMPLKCLHGMLVNPPIAIVGLSNWVLDPAKMNRAVLVQRPEPSDDDISHTGSSIMGLPDGVSSSPIVQLLEKISRAYFQVYTHQKDRDFIGMRDYYSLIKSLRADLPKNMKKLLETNLSKDKAIFAICRNFSGRDDILRDVLYVMCRELYGVKGKKKLKKMEEMTIGEVERAFGFQRPLLPQLIRSNLESCTRSKESRHLMLLTNNCAALPLIFSCGLVNRSKTKVIIGSEFVEDNTELFLVQQMNEVKLAMAKGKVIVLMNADNMYEALYDVLNQRYLEKTDQKTGKKQRLLRLAIGSRSSLCQVAPGFRIIVIVEKEYAYRSLDLPLLNRFEKQILTPINALERRSLKVSEELSTWADSIVKETSLPSTQHVFCGFHPGTIPSLVFRLSQQKNCNIDEAKRCLKKIATPSALTLSNSLRGIKGVAQHSNLTSYVKEMFDCSSNKPISSVVMTCSPVTHLEGDVLDSLKDIAEVTRCRLDQVKSEKAFSLVVKRHLTPQEEMPSGKRLLLVQFDPIMCSSLQINHAKFLVTNEMSSWRSSSRGEETVAVLFLVHMPPGIKARARTFVLDFRVDWDYLFLDDIRGFILTKELNQKISLPSLLQAPLKDLFNYGLVNLKEVVSSQISAAISRMRLPIPPAPYPLPFLSDSMDSSTAKEKFFASNRIHALKGLLQIPEFDTFFHESIYSLLEHYGNERDAERGNLFLHTSLAIGDFSSGTLLQSLERTVAELTLQAMIALLILFEKNFTLGTLRENPELWMELVNNKNAVDLGTVRVGFELGGREVMRHLQSRLPHNTGKIQILVSQFPFSYAVFALLNGGQTREAIEAALGAKIKVGIERFELEAEFLEKTFASFFGDKVAQLVHSKAEKEGGSLPYFYDFVGMIAPPVDKLALEEVQFVYQAIFQSFHPQSLRTPATIHAAFWQNENQIQVVCSILSILSPSDRLRVLSAMHEACNLRDHSHRLVCVLEAVFDAVFRIIWSRASQLAFVQQPWGIPCSHETTVQLATLIATVGENMVDLLSAWETSIKALPSFKPAKGAISPIQRWSSVKALKILLEGYEKLQWGMGERAQNLMSLLQEPANNPCTFKFFGSFFTGLALFYAPIRCCIQCSAVLHHTQDHRNYVPTLLCSSCERAEEEKAKAGSITKGDANALGEVFWDDFLLPPGEREARALRVATPNNHSKKRKRDENEGSGIKKRKGESCVDSESNEEQIQQLSRRFLERGFVRYVGEVLFPDGLTAERLKQVDQQLIDYVNRYANSEEPLVKSKSEEIHLLVECAPSPSTCLALMHILLRAEAQANIEEGEDDQDCLFKITSPAGKSVYLSYCLSKFGEPVEHLEIDSCASLTTICQFIPQDELEIVTSWLSSSNPSPNWGFLRKEIRALARVQAALRWYGRCLASDNFPSEELLADPSALEAFHKYFNDILIGRSPAQQYVLKTIKETAGINGVLVFLLSEDKKGAKWVSCDDSQLSVVIEDCPIGPLLPDREFGEQYKFREKIHAVFADPNNASAFKNVVNDQGLVKFFIPALYHEVMHKAVTEKNPASLIAKVIEFSDRVKDHMMESNADRAKFIPLVTQMILILSFGPVHDGIDSSILPCPHDGKSELSTKGTILCQTALRILSGSFLRPDSWMAELMTTPDKWAQRYIPGSKFETPLSNVSWYECPNGHPYSIGECGKPMQLSKCSECGVEIGGRDHSNVPGVRLLHGGVKMDFVSHFGYQLLPFERVGRLESSAAFFRLLVDLPLFLSIFVTSPEQVSRLVRDKPENLRSRLVKLIGQHILELSKSHRLEAMLIGVAINAAFCNYFSPDSLMWKPGENFTKKDNVHKVEQPIKQTMHKITTDIKSSIQHRLGTSFQAAQREKVLKKALGERGWEALIEGLQNPSAAEILFRYSPSATIEEFFRATDSAPDFKERYPLLSAFVNEEERLQLVKCIIPVLEWHRLLFSVFQSNEIDHEEAGKITNEEAVQRLPTEAERQKGKELLAEYCEAFNKSFHLVGELLYECQQNIFLQDGEVTLFGQKMSPTTPIAFSLPSISEGQATKDPMGLCTVGLLTALHRAHEECLRLGEGGEEEQNQQQGEAEVVGLPEISCSSFSRVLRQKLIIYDRQAHLLPLLNTASSPDERGGLKYNLSAIEDELRLGVLHGKQSLRLHIKYYQFRGDVRTSNRLTTLRNRVPQSDVSKQTMQLILHEVDIESRMIRLLSNLEMVINFVARIGGDEAKEIGIGRKLVREYAIETLQMDAGDWEEGTTPTVNEQIRLCHLSCLFMRLQEESGGNPLEDIPAEFREGLDEELKAEFRKPMETESKDYSYLLLPKLKNFLVDKVANAEPGWERDPELMLKDLLQYEFTSDQDWEWFDDHFPDVLKLKHAFGLYQWLIEWKG